MIAGSGLGLLVSQLNNYTLVADLGGARQRGRRRELGGGIVRAVVRVGLRRRDHAGGALDRVHDKAESSNVLPPADQQRVADVLEDDAQVMSNTQLEELLADEPEPIQDEIIRINTDARPLALQVALLLPILAGLIGLLNSFRMMRLPDPKPIERRRGLGPGLTSQLAVGVGQLRLDRQMDVAVHVVGPDAVDDPVGS